jgi:hypothetical protein
MQKHEEKLVQQERKFLEEKDILDIFTLTFQHFMKEQENLMEEKEVLPKFQSYQCHLMILLTQFLTLLVTLQKAK